MTYFLAKRKKKEMICETLAVAQISANFRKKKKELLRVRKKAPD